MTTRIVVALFDWPDAPVTGKSGGGVAMTAAWVVATAFGSSTLSSATLPSSAGVPASALVVAPKVAVATGTTSGSTASVSGVCTPTVIVTVTVTDGVCSAMTASAGSPVTLSGG